MREIYRRLSKRFGPLDPPRRLDPLEELILTVLSQNTSDVNRDRAFAAMRERFPTWEALAAARSADLAAAIRPGGLSNVKAPRILAILREIADREEGSLDLSWMAPAKDEDVRDYLMSLPGVGPKTTACVLAFSLGRPALPVDTHVFRVARRLGFLDDRTGQRIHVHRRGGQRVPVEGGKGEQVVDHLAQLARVRFDSVEQPRHLRIELVAVLGAQDFGEAADGSERSPEVVRDGMEERLQFPARLGNLEGLLLDSRHQLLVPKPQRLLRLPALGEVLRELLDPLLRLPHPFRALPQAGDHRQHSQAEAGVNRVSHPHGGIFRRSGRFWQSTEP